MLFPQVRFVLRPSHRPPLCLITFLGRRNIAKQFLKELPVKFYHEFAEHVKQDPTGYETLKRVLGEGDMDAFKKKWEKFVLELRSQ